MLGPINNPENPPAAPPGAIKPPATSNGNGQSQIRDYRLDRLESDVKEIRANVEEIKEKVFTIAESMNHMATKAFVLSIFGVTGGVLMFSIFIHIGIRLLESGP